MKENKRYNRLESQNNHYYYNNYGLKGFGQKTISGYIKCKLVHTDGFSVIIPDQVYFNWNDSLYWIQPFTFLPCRLADFGDDILCDIYFDISSGYTSKARFMASDFLRSYDDGSQLYKCELLVPDNAEEYAIEKAEIDEAWNLKLELFHHTNPDIKKLILESGKLLGSKWNIQGSNELKNSEHIYFTPLHEIKMDQDLEKIAMSNEEEIKLIRDNFNLPDALLPGWKEKYKGDILFMKVYRENRENRTATLSYMIPADYISPQHILKHSPNGEAVYYEISTPFIHRAQIENGAALEFDGKLIKENQHVTFHDFIFIGDATRLDGLKATYDEENTTHIFKIEFLGDKTMLEFWFENANQCLF